jgi:hypothetical protein
MTCFFNIHLSRIINLLRRRAAGKVLRSFFFGGGTISIFGFYCCGWLQISLFP